MLANICAARFKTAVLGVGAPGVATSGTGAGIFAVIGRLEVTLPWVGSLEAFDSLGRAGLAEELRAGWIPSGKTFCASSTGSADPKLFRKPFEPASALWFTGTGSDVVAGVVTSTVAAAVPAGVPCASELPEATAATKTPEGDAGSEGIAKPEFAQLDAGLGTPAFGTEMLVTAGRAALVLKPLAAKVD